MPTASTAMTPSSHITAPIWGSSDFQSMPMGSESRGIAASPTGTEGTVTRPPAAGAVTDGAAGYNAAATGGSPSTMPVPTAPVLSAKSYSPGS